MQQQECAQFARHFTTEAQKHREKETEDQVGFKSELACYR
jgi:hypothetical protein